jgi:hypothetical protein
VWVFGNQQQINKKAKGIFKIRQELWGSDAKSATVMRNHQKQNTNQNFLSKQVTFLSADSSRTAEIALVCRHEKVPENQALDPYNISVCDSRATWLLQRL